MKPIPKKLKRPVWAYYADYITHRDKIRIIYPTGKVEYMCMPPWRSGDSLFTRGCTSRKNSTESLKAIKIYDNEYDPSLRLIHWEYL